MAMQFEAKVTEKGEKDTERKHRFMRKLEIGAGLMDIGAESGSITLTFEEVDTGRFPKGRMFNVTIEPIEENIEK